MASIRVSGDVVRHVTNCVNALYRIRVYAKPDTSIGDRLYELIYSEYAERIAALPPEFFTKTETISISGFETAFVGRRQRRLHLPLSSARVMAQVMPSNRFIEETPVTGYSQSYTDYHILYTPETAEMCNTLEAHCKAIEETAALSEKVQTYVRALLKSHSTLAPCIKEFPPLQHLLPPEVKAKINIKRGMPKQIVLEPYLQQFTSDLIAHKLSGKEF